MALGTRSAAFHATTRVATTEIAATSALVARTTGIRPPANKAIVGANAFAHEAGIHQDGVLKHRATYEVVSAEAVGRTSTLVLGKHSGRRALRERMQQIGVRVDDARLNDVSEGLKSVASRRRHGRLHDEDLHRLSVGVAPRSRTILRRPCALP